MNMIIKWILTVLSIIIFLAVIIAVTVGYLAWQFFGIDLFVIPFVLYILWKDE